MKKLLVKIVVPLVAIAVVGGGIFWYVKNKSKPAVSFITTAINRGDLLVTINATGTVEPEEVIDVGAQVAGKITQFGKDANGKTIDYGSMVKKGNVLALIDDALYRAEATKAEAQVKSSEAGLIRASADLQQAEAKLRQSDQDWQRASKLGPLKVISQSAYDAAKSTYEMDVANKAVCVASVRQAEATLAHSQAAMRYARQNLEYCTIVSPVDGVIIDRRVNVGQTVVSSMSAPSLFLLAKDLRQMQVWVAVNEADIGKIYPGQPVGFTVDAFPGENFVGKVGKIRLNASMTQNVVTYTVEIETDNTSARLLPYLTANVKFELSNQTDITYVSNAALRWNPTENLIRPELLKKLKATESTDAENGGNSKKSDKKTQGHKNSTATPTTGMLWVVDGNYVRPVTVTVGQTDGSVTQVSGDGLPQGQVIVTGIRSSTTTQTASNPFVPKIPRGGRSGRSGGGGPPH